MSKLFTMTDEDRQNLVRLETVFRSGGIDPTDEKFMPLQDALAVQNAGFLIPRVMTQIVQEGIEPLLIGTKLLQRIEYTPGMQTVFPAVEPLIAEEIGDGMGVPFKNINVAGAQTFGLSVSRHGLGLRISKEFIDASTYPWINYWLRMAGNALARHKEEYIFNTITNLGTVVFDNATTARASSATAGVPQKGVTTGRDYRGKFNGSLTVDDIFDMYASGLSQGYVPDTLLVHPMAWLMWIKDPIMREFAIQAGGGSFFAQWTGNASVKGNQFYNFGGLGYGQGQTGQYAAGSLTGGQQSTVGGLPQLQTSAPVLPNYLGIPFRILVSPFMNYDPTTRLTDILMFDSNTLGALIVKEDPHVQSWTDPRYNIQEMIIEESYGVGILNEAQGIVTARNVKVTANQFEIPARTVFNISDPNSTFEDLSTITQFGSTPTNVLD